MQRLVFKTWYLMIRQSSVTHSTCIIYFGCEWAFLVLMHFSASHNEPHYLRLLAVIITNNVEVTSFSSLGGQLMLSSISEQLSEYYRTDMDVKIVLRMVVTESSAVITKLFKTILNLYITYFMEYILKDSLGQLA